MKKKIEHSFPEPSLLPERGSTGFFSSSPVPLSSGTPMLVSREQIRSARLSDLYRFLETCHGDRFKKVGTCLTMRGRDSLYVKSGFPGYHDFKNNEHGNSIDFLVYHLGYSFVDAVVALNGVCTGSATSATHDNNDSSPRCAAHPDPCHKTIELPPAAPHPHRRLYAYLASRAIPYQTVQQLEKQGVIYQEASHNNAVFVNPQKDYCELRGTFSYAGHPFHGCLKSRSDGFWYLKGSGSRPHTAYICEGAIDAISLYQLHKMEGKNARAVYISIGGVYNQQAIDRIKRSIQTILAVDNDHAGALCRERNPDIDAIIPFHKDWNDDLKANITNNLNNSL